MYLKKNTQASKYIDFNIITQNICRHIVEALEMNSIFAKGKSAVLGRNNLLVMLFL